MIQFRVTKNYGNEAIYIVGEQKEIIRRLVNKKTVSRQDLQALAALGLQIEQVNDITI